MTKVNVFRNNSPRISCDVFVCSYFMRFGRFFVANFPFIRIFPRKPTNLCFSQFQQEPINGTHSGLYGFLIPVIIYWSRKCFAYIVELNDNAVQRTLFILIWVLVFCLYRRVLYNIRFTIRIRFISGFETVYINTITHCAKSLTLLFLLFRIIK